MDDALTLAAEATAPSRKLVYYNTASITRRHKHGMHRKTLMVLHETVSTDLAGLADILAIERYLAKEDYGIHGMSDLEGHAAWSYGCGNDIYYHAGGVNGIADGIEQVSYIPALLAKALLTKEQAWHHWLAREKQLEATAKLLACWHNSNQKNHPLVFVDGSGKHKGVTSHWNVSKFHKESQGHSDCWPHHLGGYYPILLVIHMAQGYAKLGYHF